MKLTEMLGQYEELLDKKDQLAKDTKDNNAAIDKLKAEIAEMMIDEDILCVFKGIESGYFITETCEDGIRNRYRVKSIKKSKVVKNASVDAADEEE